MRKQRWKIVAEHVDITTRPDLSRAGGDRAKKLSPLYEADEVDAVYIVFNEFKSVLAQNLTLEKLLPIEPEPALAGGRAETRTKAGTAGRLSLRAAAGRTFRAPAAALRASADFPRAGRIRRRRNTPRA